MWRRVSSRLQALASYQPAAFNLHQRSTAPVGLRGFLASLSPFQKTFPLLSHPAVSDAAKKRVEDIMPIATGHEREELEAELEGRKRFDMDAPVGPFGTKEAPAIVKSYYDRRIVGCPGGEGAGSDW